MAILLIAPVHPGQPRWSGMLPADVSGSFRGASMAFSTADLYDEHGEKPAQL
jgi:hypothetical protein